MLNLAAIKVGAMRYNSPWTQVCFVSLDKTPVCSWPGRYSRFRHILFGGYVLGPRWSWCRVSPVSVLVDH
jgi:hypothetical protein